MSTENNSSSTGAFAAHKPQEAIEPNEANKPEDTKKLTTFGRMLLFFVVPFGCSIFSCAVAYVDPKNNKKIDFDRDFLFPFIMGLVLVISIGFQTRGYRKDPEPMISWPKKVIKKRVVKKYVDEDGNEIDPSELPEELDSEQDKESKKEK